MVWEGGGDCHCGWAGESLLAQRSHLGKGQQAQRHLPRLETCASRGAGAITRPVRSSRRDGRSAALMTRSHRPGRPGEHVIHPEKEPPTGDDADSNEPPDHHGEQDEQELLAPAPLTIHQFRSHRLPRVPIAIR
jgi:hypothetical protein